MSYWIVFRITPLRKGHAGHDGHCPGLDVGIQKHHIGHMIATLRESKTKLSDLVQRASRGEEVLITVRGKPSARLVPVGQADFVMDDWMRELASLRTSLKSSQSAGRPSALDEVREDRW